MMVRRNAISHRRLLNKPDHTTCSRISIAVSSSFLTIMTQQYCCQPSHQAVAHFDDEG